MSKRTIPVSKVCPSCQSEFLVCPPGHKSRIYPPNRQVFCSRPCAQRSRYRHGSACASLPPTVAAYIAGFLDGEGSIILYRRRDAVAMRVSFSNCDLSVLRWLVAQTGIGSVVSKPVYSDHHRQSLFAQINSSAAASLLEQVLPYLQIKHAQAQLAIEFQRRLQDPALKADRSWQYSVREQMQALNRRGPQP